MRGFLDLFRLSANRPMGLEEFFGALGTQSYSITLRVIPLVDQQVEEGEIERYICRFEERHKVHAKLGKNSESTIARQKGQPGEYVELLRTLGDLLRRSDIGVVHLTKPRLK